MKYNKEKNKQTGNRGKFGAQKKTRSGKNPSPNPRMVKSGETLVGVIEGNSKGYGFLVCEGREEDAFISAEKMNGAIHGDRVEAALVSRNKGGGEAVITKILSRRYPNIVGTFFAERDYGVCVPDDIRLAKEIYIPRQKSGGAAHLDKIVVEVNWTGRSKTRAPGGIVVEVLGPIENKGVDILSIIRSYNLYESFPAHVIREAEKVALPVPKDEKARRRDFTGDTVFTIDGDDSKDFDDAVSLVENENGNYVLCVHIADVAHYVIPNSALDKEALKRGTSVYFTDRVLPMLPEQLSNDICSLKEGVERLTLSVIMEIDKVGTVISHEVCEGVIKSSARMTYSDVAKILNGDAAVRTRYASLNPTLERMEQLAKILFKKRKQRGNIDFEIAESEIVLDETGRATDIRRKPRLISHRIIEEFMLAANETVAERMYRLDAPFVYRVHEQPPSEKVESLIDFLAALALKFPGDEKKPQPRDFNTLLESVAGGVYETAVSRVALRSMSKACYMPVNKGHFGLAAEYYCHFTSPIRRYPDLAIHRIIKDYLVNGKACFNKYKTFVQEASRKSSDAERSAEKAEREADSLKKAEYMEDKIGLCFNGIISGVTEWGVFVELINTVEGMIRIENLSGDCYAYNPRHMSLTNGVRTYRIGNPLTIEVAAVNGSKIEFREASGAKTAQ